MQNSTNSTQKSFIAISMYMFERLSLASMRATNKNASEVVQDIAVNHLEVLNKTYPTILAYMHKAKTVEDFILELNAYNAELYRMKPTSNSFDIEREIEVVQDIIGETQNVLDHNA